MAGFHKDRVENYLEVILVRILEFEAGIHLLFLCVTEITGCEITFFIH